MGCSRCLCLRQKLPKVNKELALKLLEEGDDDAELALRKKKGKVKNSCCTCVIFFLFCFRANV